VTGNWNVLSEKCRDQAARCVTIYNSIAVAVQSCL